MTGQELINWIKENNMQNATIELEPMAEINPNHIKEIKAKFFNRITEVIADHSGESPDDKYFEIKELTNQCEAEINEYKLRKRRV